MRVEKWWAPVLVALAAYVVATPARANDPDSLDAFVAQVKKLVAGGADDATIASFVTGVIDRRITNGNGFEGDIARAKGYWTRNDDIFDRWAKYEDERENLAETCGREYEARAKWAWDLQYGHCAETSTIAYYVLKAAGIPARIYEVPGHSFCVMRVADYAKGDHVNPEAYVVDGWRGSAVRWSDIPHGTFWHPWGKMNDPTRTDVTDGYDSDKRHEQCQHRGILAGRVHENGGYVAGATVVISGPDKATVKTGGDGVFRQRLLLEGSYAATATAPDGKKGSATGVVNGGMKVTFVEIDIGKSCRPGGTHIGTGGTYEMPCVPVP